MINNACRDSLFTNLHPTAGVTELSVFIISISKGQGYVKINYEILQTPGNNSSGLAQQAWY